jgi:hypothetical protein
MESSEKEKCLIAICEELTAIKNHQTYDEIEHVDANQKLLSTT